MPYNHFFLSVSPGYQISLVLWSSNSCRCVYGHKKRIWEINQRQLATTILTPGLHPGSMQDKRRPWQQDSLWRRQEEEKHVDSPAALHAHTHPSAHGRFQWWKEASQSAVQSSMTSGKSTFPAQLFTRVCKCSWMRCFWLRFSWQPAFVGQDTQAPQVGDQARKRARKCALCLHPWPSRSVKCVFSFSGGFWIFWSLHRSRREELLWMFF